MAGKAETKTRILDAAEWLFAEHGFTDTSLRMITSRAGVNLAAVNYHFGSKKALIQAVLGRYLEHFMPYVDQQLAGLMHEQPQPSLIQVFNALVGPLLSLSRERRNGTAIFMQLLGRGYTDAQGHLRWFITHHYGGVLSHFTEAIHRAKPELTRAELFWRLHFTLGTAVFTMASNKALREIAASDFGQQLEIEDLIHKVIPYLAAGVGAPLLPEPALSQLNPLPQAH